MQAANISDYANGDLCAAEAAVFLTFPKLKD